MTTIGKLNFFRWALETRIIDYIEAHQEEIRAGYNAYLKETMTTQKRTKNDSVSSTSSTSSTESERMVSLKSDPTTRITRRRTKQSPSSLNKLQVYTTPIVLEFT